MGLYSLEDMDNELTSLSYTSNALRQSGNRNLISQLRHEIGKSNFRNITLICNKYIEIANKSF